MKIYSIPLFIFLILFVKSFSFGQVTIFSEDFNSGLGSWTIVNGGTNNNGTSIDSWHHKTNYSGNTLDGSAFAFIDSDGAGHESMDEELISSTYDISAYSYVELQFDQYFNHNDNDVADVDVWNGSSWVNIYSTSSDIGAWSNPNSQTINVSAHINSNFKVRFHYYNGYYEWYWAVDNVVLKGTNYASQWISMNVGSATWCKGETRDVKVTVKNNGPIPWTDSSPDVNIGCKWDGDSDYFVRVNAGNLAPGAQQEYTLTMTAPTTIGANHLTFDVVKEGDCWFGNNNGSCGPGNITYSTATNVVKCPDCNWQICLTDSKRNGWNGGYIEVTSGGVTYGPWNIPGNSGYAGAGPECYDIPVNIGDDIIIDYTQGSESSSNNQYRSQNAYLLLDSYGNLMYSSGDDATIPVDHTYLNVDCDDHPLTPNTQDCLGAIPICGDSYYTETSYTGQGNIPFEINGGISCLTTGELHDVWYVFTVQNTGDLGFVINPNTNTNDYDWAVFNITNASCADIATDASLQVSCNYDGGGGNTGPTGSTAARQELQIPVIQGDVYVINVSNFSPNNQDGYLIDFSMSSGVVVDTTAPELHTILNAPTCGQNQITARFTENVDTLTVNSGDFYVSGPGGPYSITAVNSQSGTANDRDFTLTLSSQLTSGGTYTLVFSGQVDDACTNSTTGNSLNFTVTGISSSVISDDSGVICANNPSGTATASASGGSGTYSYLWSTGAITASISSLVAGTYTVSVSDDVGVCYDIETVVINPDNSGTAIGIWVGTDDTDWLNCKNWGYGTGPDNTIDVIIPTSCPNYPIIPFDISIKPSIGGICKSIKIENAASLTISVNHSLTIDDANLVIDAGGTLVVEDNLTIQNNANLYQNGGEIFVGGNFTNNSNYTCTSGNFEFNGAIEQIIGGTTTTSFSNLTVNNSNNPNALKLANNIIVRNNLTMTNGDLNLVDYNINLGASGMLIDETTSSKIKGDIATSTGTITAKRTVNNVTNYNPANLGIEITTPDNLGEITIVRGHKIQTGSYGTPVIATQGIERYYEIPGIGKLDVANGKTINMHYWTSELNGLSEVSLEGYQWITEGRSSSWWTPLDGSVNTSTKIVTISGNPYDDYVNTSTWYGFNFSDKFTLGSDRAPLPVELVDFNSDCNDDYVELTWKTLSEKNNDYFTILKSINGDYFNEIGIVYGNGNSNKVINYSYNDYDFYNGLAYYKLKQTDFDRTTSESKIITAECSSIISRETIFNLYPNPSINGANVFLEITNAEKDAEILVVINDILGNLLYSKVIITDVNGSTVNAIDQLNRLDPGTYIIIATSEDKLYKKKLIIN